MSDPAPGAARSRFWTAVLWILALTFPVGALLQPWLLPSRSHLPQVDRQLNSPVILVTVPGLRADRLHHLGYAPDITPGLDRIAEQGTSFRTFYSSSNDAVETLASMFSGRCASRTGVQGAEGALAEGSETLAERFGTARFTRIAVLADAALTERGLLQGFDDVRVLPGATADVLCAAALDAIHAAPGNRYFLWLDLPELLAPYGGPALDLRAVVPEAPAGFGSTLADYDLDAALLAQRGWGTRELSWLSARYDAALQRLDAALAAFTAALWQEHRLETLTLCVVGTRGERLDDRPGRAFTHGVDLFEPSIHVACLLRLPAQQARGQLTSRFGQTVDLGPTLFELGTKRPWQTPVGVSLADAVVKQYNTVKSLQAEGLVQPLRGGPSARGLVLRPSDHKLHCAPDGTPREIYRLADDPGERSPVRYHPEQVQVLLDKCRDWLDRCATR